MKLSFKKGMTLQQYMNQMKAQQSQTTQLQSQQINNNSVLQDSNNLYISSRLTQHQRQPSNKLIPFNIPEMDEDNYESSVDNFPETPRQGKLYNLKYTEYEQKQHEKYQKYTEQDQCETYNSKQIRQTPNFCQNQTKNISNSNNTMRKSDIQMKISTMYIQKKNSKQQQKKQKSHSKQFKQYRIKHQSNSPFKKPRQLDLTPTKPSLSKTLYGTTFLTPFTSNPPNPTNISSFNTASSTLYQSKLITNTSKLSQNYNIQQYIKGTIHSRESKNEKYFQNKNKKQLDSLISYENMIRNKYQQKINVNGIRVEGVKDKLYQRRNKVGG